MKKSSLGLILLSTALFATSEVNSFSEVFSEATTSGNIKYYYIQTDKDKSYTGAADTSAYANSIGGQIHFDTARYKGFSAYLTFMTTNPFLLSNDPAKVDTSIIGKDNGARGGDATKGFSVLGEAYIDYRYKDFMVTYGRKVIKTPLMNAKEVRMLPSTFNGLYLDYTQNKYSHIGFDYVTEFKQRTSNEFINVIQHALGDDTEAVTGSSGGAMWMADYNFKTDDYALNIYDCYAENFINSVYTDASYKMHVGVAKLHFAAQYIYQQSVGNADDNLATAGSITNGKKIRSNAVGAKVIGNLGYGTLTLAYSKVFSDNTKHDSLVLPWDGTPLFTNAITSNDLFQSIYGHALNADSIYIGGSQGFKVAYKERFNGIGLKGVSLSAAYLNTSNSKFEKGHQSDYNVVLGYTYDKAFSLALKGIWVQNSASADKTGNVTQLKLLSQYRVITNYKF